MPNAHREVSRGAVRAEIQFALQLDVLLYPNEFLLTF
jgi:hypothetical protein